MGQTPSQWFSYINWTFATTLWVGDSWVSSLFFRWGLMDCTEKTKGWLGWGLSLLQNVQRPLWWEWHEPEKEHRGEPGEIPPSFKSHGEDVGISSQGNGGPMEGLEKGVMGSHYALRSLTGGWLKWGRNGRVWTSWCKHLVSGCLSCMGGSLHKACKMVGSHWTQWFTGWRCRKASAPKLPFSLLTWTHRRAQSWERSIQQCL